MTRRQSQEDRIRALEQDDAARARRRYNFRVHGKRLQVGASCASDDDSRARNLSRARPLDSRQRCAASLL
jgi:hypothetical protein